MEDLVKLPWQEAFAGRPVLVTGHTGFKGGWLALWLQRLGADVHGYSLAPDTQSLYRAIDLRRLLAQDHHADLRDRDRLRQAMEIAQPEVIFHLAAQALVRPSYRDPVETFATNVVGTAQLLDLARTQSSVRAIVVVTSDKCYENREWIWPYREDEHLGGADPYSASKGCAEIVAASFRRSYFESPESPFLATCRAGNVFGGGDWSADRLIPDIARSILTDRPVVLRNPQSVRPWQHVLEPLRGYLMVAARLLQGEAAEAWNFGPSPQAEIAVGELANRVVALWGRGSVVIQQDPHAVHEAQLLRLDSSKAAQLLNWKPALSLDDGIRLTAEWYSACSQSPPQLADLTASQIDSYQRLVTQKPASELT